MPASNMVLLAKMYKPEAADRWERRGEAKKEKLFPGELDGKNLEKKCYKSSLRAMTDLVLAVFCKSN